MERLAGFLLGGGLVGVFIKSAALQGRVATKEDVVFYGVVAGAGLLLSLLLFLWIARRSATLKG